MYDLGTLPAGAEGSSSPNEHTPALEALRRIASSPTGRHLELKPGKGTDLAPAADAVWQAFLDGEWSVIERFDSDDNRYWVAVENDSETAAAKRLTALERRVVDILATGRAQKLIAYELRVRESTVSKLAASARAKLGLKHRAELVELYAAFHTAAS